MYNKKYCFLNFKGAFICMGFCLERPRYNGVVLEQSFYYWYFYPKLHGLY